MEASNAGTTLRTFQVQSINVHPQLLGLLPLGSLAHHVPALLREPCKLELIQYGFNSVREKRPLP